jgi:hypothetical protein
LIIDITGFLYLIVDYFESNQGKNQN